MKKYILVLCSILISAFIIANTPENVSSEIREDINLKFFNKSRVILETGFGNSAIINKEAIEELKGKSILKVNLIYTTYREADDFDQIDLNEIRWENLYRLFPELKHIDQVKLVQIGTEKCKTRECASQQLHGFIIEYKKELFGYRNLEIQEKRANSKMEISMTGKSGTKVYIPANSFVDLNGNEISGTVSLQLREALTAEDSVTANLLTITDKNEALESGGMIQIQAFNNGKQLKLRDGANADVSIPKTKDNADMQVWKGEWIDGQLKWNEPQELSTGPAQVVSSEMELVSEISDVTFDENRVAVDSVSWTTINKVVTEIRLHVNNDTLKYNKQNYSLEVGAKDSLSEYQSRRIRNWFAQNKVENITYRFWANNRWVAADGTLPNQSLILLGANSQKPANYDTAYYETINAFNMSQLGWANIDRFMKIDERKKTNLEVLCKNEKDVDNLKITLLIPGWNVFLPGHKLISGNYCFAFDNCASKYSLPKGEKAFVILNGIKDEKSYSSIEQIQLGDTNVLETKLVEKDKKTTLQEIKKLI